MEAVAARLPDVSFWKGKRVLVTGHTGFKGAWLTQWLCDMGAKVCGLSLDPITSPDLWSELRNDLEGFDLREDIRGTSWQDKVDAFRPEIAFHLAAQPLVVTGWKEPKLTFDTNLGGMIQFLEWSNRSKTLVAGLIVTSDKVYKLDGSKVPRIETDELGGVDPYSASKAAAEMIAHSWPIDPEKRIATARSGNVIGGGDWAEDRLIPDLVRAWQSGQSFSPRNPSAIRPWQHVIEPLNGYILMAERLYTMDLPNRAYNFGPALRDQISVSEVINETQRILSGKMSLQVLVGPDASTYHESEFLLLDASLAKSELGWDSILDWRTAMRMTLDWYVAFAGGTAASELVRGDLKRYRDLIANLEIGGLSSNN